MDLRARIWEVLDIFHHGEQNASTMSALASTVGIAVEKLRDEVRAMRRDGFLIASTTKPPYGLFIPATQAEAEAYIAQLESRLDEQVLTLETQRGAVKAQFADARIDRTYVVSHGDHERQVERLPLSTDSGSGLSGLRIGEPKSADRARRVFDPDGQHIAIGESWLKRLKSRYGWQFTQPIELQTPDLSREEIEAEIEQAKCSIAPCGREEEEGNGAKNNQRTDGLNGEDAETGQPVEETDTGARGVQDASG